MTHNASGRKRECEREEVVQGPKAFLSLDRKMRNLPNDSEKWCYSEIRLIKIDTTLWFYNFESLERRGEIQVRKNLFLRYKHDF